MVLVSNAQVFHIVSCGEFINDLDFTHVQEVRAGVHLVVLKAEIGGVRVPDAVYHCRHKVFLAIFLQSLV